jgi:hypothetical protein
MIVAATAAPTCPWCHDRHDLTALCQRAQRGMSRRSFLFLTATGVAGALLAPAPAWPFQEYGASFTVEEPRIGQLVAEAWNAVIGDGPADNIFVDRHFARLMAEQLHARIDPKGKR